MVKVQGPKRITLRISWLDIVLLFCDEIMFAYFND